MLIISIHYKNIWNREFKFEYFKREIQKEIVKVRAVVMYKIPQKYSVCVAFFSKKRNVILSVPEQDKVLQIFLREDLEVKFPHPSTLFETILILLIYIPI